MINKRSQLYRLILKNNTRIYIEPKNLNLILLHYAKENKIKSIARVKDWRQDKIH